MEDAAENLEFERAAYLRDQVQAIESVVQWQKVISTAAQDEDVIAIARNEGEACAEVFLIRGGKLIGSEHFMLANSDEEEPAALMSSFITQFYDAAPFVPPQILVPEALGEAQVIEEWLRTKRGAKVQLKVPRRGEKHELMEMAAANAATALEQMRAKWMADRKKTSAALQELADYLDLPEPPQRIECYDISNIQGTSQVASMVVFEDGQPAKQNYRRFQIKSVDGANDFASMQEVLRRRFKRAKSDADRWALPNLVIVDGGKGQLNAAREVFSELEVSSDVSLVSLAKENEEIFVPNQSSSIWLPRTSQSLYLVQRIRDEAHRFAISYHRNVRTKRAFKSQLDDVPGIGPKRKAELIKKFGSVKAIREASVDELALVPGMTRASAAALKEKL
jgi:excinuclease ABC subunit C